jgi:23S rRNA U2552 (ribose-2'-O)-methylase RlmE/FtsJ
LVIGGHLIFKTFNGEETAQLFKEVKQLFEKTHCFKPDSSKSNSKEVYIIGQNFIGAKKDFNQEMLLASLNNSQEISEEEGE